MISNFQSLNILAKNSILDVLNEPQGQYVWELVFRKFNSFFHRSIYPWGMFIVEWYIFIGNIATDRVKNSLNATSMKFDCSLFFDYMKIESYIFVHSGPLDTMMLGSVDK